jgi:hypothetical protein
MTSLAWLRYRGVSFWKFAFLECFWTEFFFFLFLDLLKHKSRPEVAAKEAETWVVSEREMKERLRREKEERELKEKLEVRVFLNRSTNIPF